MFADLALNVPNLLTLLRILLVPVFVGLVMVENFSTATVIFAVAGLTDALDGYIAKRFTQRTNLGAWLDPFADKFLLVSAFVVLTINGWIPAFLCVLVISRDVVIIGGIVMLQLFGRKVEIAPSLAGKLTTALQILTVIYALLTGGKPGEVFTALILLTALITVYSGFYYVRREVKIQTSETGLQKTE
jgi:cardiolipin synthase